MQCCCDTDDGLTRELSRGTPGTSHPQRKGNKLRERARKNHQYFSDAFSTREPHNSPRDRVNQSSIIVVEIKTNAQVVDSLKITQRSCTIRANSCVKLEDDGSQLLSNLSFNLAQIYQRPENCIFITIEHNERMLLGSSSQPAYLVSVSGLSCSIAPMTNIRNTKLIQSVLEDLLQIPASRGVIKYAPVADENFATDGVTMMGKIQQLERESQVRYHGVIRNISSSVSKRLKNGRSQSSPLSPPPECLSPAVVRGESHTLTPERTMDVVDAGDKRLGGGKAKIRQFFSL
jgi:Macrophage migration inhibitory factor (MIF)